MKVRNGKRIYGAWAGNEKGTPEDISRCIEEVWPQGRIWLPHQCYRKRGYGKEGLYCKQHAKLQALKTSDK